MVVDQELRRMITGHAAGRVDEQDYVPPRAVSGNLQVTSVRCG